MVVTAVIAAFWLQREIACAEDRPRTDDGVFLQSPERNGSVI